MIEIAKVRVTGTSVRCNGSKIPRGMAGAYISVQYDSAWDDLVKTVVFKGSQTIDVVTNSRMVEVPTEVLQSVGKRVYIGFYGTATTGKIIIPTFWAELGTVVESTDPSGDESSNPALPVYAQLTEQMYDLQEGYSEVKETVNAVNKTVEELNKKGLTSGIVNNSFGDFISLTDSAERPIMGMKLYGKTTQNGTPTPEAPVPLDSVGDDGSVTVKVGTSETDDNPQSLTISTPNGLPGIPVASGGNYTDGSGQQWVCDEMDFENGVYVRRIGVVDFANPNTIVLSRSSIGISGKYRMVIANDSEPVSSSGITKNLFCTVAPAGNANETWVGTNCACYATIGSILLYLEDIAAMTGAEATEWLRERSVKVQYILATPTVTALSAEQLAQYSTLHTNYPSTTIINDEDAGMEVKYVADTKLYIDKKFDQLAAAMLNN